MNPIFEITKLHLQKGFPQHTECRLRRIYGIDSKDKILCGLWTARFFRKGFVFTDKALYWNLGFASERTCGCLLKSESEGVATFTMDKVPAETLNLSSKDAASDFVFKLAIKTDKTEKTLYFKEVSEEQKTVFLNTLSYGFNQNEFPQQDLMDIMLSEEPLVFYNGLDCVLNSFYSAKEKIKETFVSFSNNVKEKKQQKQKEKVERIQRTVEDTATKKSRARIFFAHFFDVIASLLFVSAVVVALKPELLAGVSFERISSSEINHVICLYVVAHIVLMREPICLAFDKIGSAFKQLRLAFAQFFRQLSLPILWW